jgi:hypothetical protein
MYSESPALCAGSLPTGREAVPTEGGAGPEPSMVQGRQEGTRYKMILHCREASQHFLTKLKKGVGYGCKENLDDRG